MWTNRGSSQTVPIITDCILSAGTLCQSLQDQFDEKGHSGYYRDFIKDYALLERPLDALREKNARWDWTPEHRAAFLALRDAVVSAKPLAQLD